MIKLSAIILMIFGHIGYLYYPDSITLLLIGRLAFPLFAMGVTQGFQYTSSKKHYLLRLLILGLLSQYPYYLVFNNYYLNICFTLFAGLVLLIVYNSDCNKLLKFLIICTLFALVDIFNFEYGMYGLALILMFHIFGTSMNGFLINIVVTFIGIYFYKYSMFQIFSVFSIIIIIILQNKTLKINQYI